jgi:hypothetical protein
LPIKQNPSYHLFHKSTLNESKLPMPIWIYSIRKNKNKNWKFFWCVCRCPND